MERKQYLILGAIACAVLLFMYVGTEDEEALENQSSEWEDEGSDGEISHAVMHEERKSGDSVTAAGFQSRMIPLPDDRKLHVVESGASKPLANIVFIHGGNRGQQKAAYFEPVMKPLAESGLCNQFAVDLLGFGESVPGATSSEGVSISTATQVSSVATYLQTSALKRFGSSLPFIIAARSAGGVTALELASHLTKQGIPISGLILTAPAGGAKLQKMLNSELKNVPTLLFWSENDPTVPFSNSEYFLSAFSDIQLVKSDKESHLFEVVETALYARHVQEFIRKIGK